MSRIDKPGPRILQLPEDRISLPRHFGRVLKHGLTFPREKDVKSPCRPKYRRTVPSSVMISSSSRSDQPNPRMVPYSHWSSQHKQENKRESTDIDSVDVFPRA